MEQFQLNKTHFIPSKSLQKVLEKTAGAKAKPASFSVYLEDSSLMHFELYEDTAITIPVGEFELKAFSSEDTLFILSVIGRIGHRGMRQLEDLLFRILARQSSQSLNIILDFQEVSWISRRGRIVFDQLISKSDILKNIPDISLILSPQLSFIYQEKLSLFSWPNVSIFESIYQAFMQMNPSEKTSNIAFQASLHSKNKKLKPIESYTKEELYQQLQQIQQTAFDAQMVIRADNEKLLDYFLQDQFSFEELEKELPSLVGIHKKLFLAAYKLKRDTLDLESRFDSLENEIQEREQKLTAHESNLSAIIENTPDQIFSLNKDLEVLLANSTAAKFSEEFWGFEMKPGIYLPIYLPREIFEQIEPGLNAALAGKASEKFMALRKKDQELFFQIAINPIINKNGEVEGISFTGRDVTSQEIIEREARHQQDLLFSISKNIQEGIFRTTREEGIQYINEAFVEMFGYQEEEELMDINLDKLYADPGQRQEIISYMQEHTYFINREVKFKKKDGSTFWGLMSSTKLENSEGDVFFDGAIRNVTDIKETRESLKKKNAALDKFVWSTSHDLRAPLVSVLGLIDVARMDASEGVNTYLNLMEISIKKLINFIHDIIDYAQNSNFRVELGSVNLRELSQEIYKDFQYLDNAPKIEFRVIERGEQAFYSDKKRIIIILKNLLSNAINYADVNKKDPFIRVEVHNSKKETSFCVKDNGIGIKENCQDKVFDMFFRATKQSKGSGIGLFIVKEAVDKLGGRIEMESSEGQGSSFCVHLPNCQEG